jgi:hypothetical protein
MEKGPVMNTGPDGVDGGQRCRGGQCNAREGAGAGKAPKGSGYALVASGAQPRTQSAHPRRGPRFLFCH